MRLAEDSEPHDRPQSLPIATLAGAVGWTDDEEAGRWVARALATFPPGARVAHVGTLPGRSPRAVRLVIQGIGRDEIVGVLERLGRRESIRPATEILAELGEVLPGSGCRSTSPPRGCCLGSGWSCTKPDRGAADGTVG